LKKAPERYESKIIAVRGDIFTTHKGLWISEAGCGDLLLAFTDEVGLTPPAGFKVKEDTDYRRFIHAINDLKPGTLDLKHRIVATLTGRFDAVTSNKKNGVVGFGHLGIAKQRIVLQQVSEVGLSDDN
jgi:hypothetical protein